MLLLLATACGPVLWHKDGSSQRDFNIDKGQCDVQADSLVNAEPFQRLTVFRACMEGKGWYRAPAK